MYMELAGRGEASYVLADGRKGCAKSPQKSGSSDLLSTLQLPRKASCVCANFQATTVRSRAKSGSKQH
ncbi:uncharacterized protein B0T23DRAFT_369594 [Neurospora hispaniola]|uniref:Uncharacterized protein n=1 Tax=Neurospora hispaniola TaxID=588809 RepID=A0AAJ0IF69_9PEZI|nr:hypothetical protein B0T23DRAFT_369594 [Neurospora hispaniola]